MWFFRQTDLSFGYGEEELAGREDFFVVFDLSGGWFRIPEVSAEGAFHRRGVEVGNYYFQGVAGAGVEACSVYDGGASGVVYACYCEVGAAVFGVGAGDDGVTGGVAPDGDVNAFEAGGAGVGDEGHVGCAGVGGHYGHCVCFEGFGGTVHREFYIVAGGRASASAVIAAAIVAAAIVVGAAARLDRRILAAGEQE